MTSKCPFHITPEEFKNGGLTLKTHQMFSVHITQEEIQKRSKSPVILHLCCEKLKQWNIMIIAILLRVRKARPSVKCFLSTVKRKPGVFFF